MATALLRWEIYANLIARPWTVVLVLLLLVGLAGVFYYQRQGRYRLAFLSSSLFILAILGATMAGNYPALLYSSLDPTRSLTVANAAAGEHGLEVALIWWSLGIALVLGYFVYLFWKVETSGTEEGYH